MCFTGLLGYWRVVLRLMPQAVLNDVSGISRSLFLIDFEMGFFSHSLLFINFVENTLVR
jgi:hypothetical protein